MLEFIIQKISLKYTQDSMRFVVSLQVQMNKFFFSTHENLKGGSSARFLSNGP